MRRQPVLRRSSQHAVRLRGGILLLDLLIEEEDDAESAGVEKNRSLEPFEVVARSDPILPVIGVEVFEQRRAKMVVRRRRGSAELEPQPTVTRNAPAWDEVGCRPAVLLRGGGGDVAGIEERIELMTQLRAIACPAEVEPVERLA